MTRGSLQVTVMQDKSVCWNWFYFLIFF